MCHKLILIFFALLSFTGVSQVQDTILDPPKRFVKYVSRGLEITPVPSNSFNWDATITGATSGTYTPTTQIATYYRVGNIVVVSYEATGITETAPVGALRVSLPFDVSLSAANFYGVAEIIGATIGPSPGNYNFSVEAEPGESFVEFVYSNDDTNWTLNDTASSVDFSSGAIHFSLIYIID